MGLSLLQPSLAQRQPYGDSSQVFRLQRSSPTPVTNVRAHAGATPADCPTITVACPDEGPTIQFSATVTPENSDLKLTYQWTVTRGEIKSGQGTTKIAVDAERNGKGIGATVDVLGLPSKCGRNASCYVTHF
jgi:hypothetical protein